MSSQSPAPPAQDLARRVLRHDAAGRGGAAVQAAAAQRDCARLRGDLAPLIGAARFAALFDRALRMARAGDPALAPLALAAGPERCPEGAGEVVTGLTAPFAHLDEAGDDPAFTVADGILFHHRRWRATPSCASCRC